MTIHIIDINSKLHEIYCDNWEEDYNEKMIYLQLKGKTVAVFHADKVIGFRIVR